MKTTVTLDENSRTCPTLLVSCFHIKFFVGLLIECLFIVTPYQARWQRGGCNHNISYDPSQMSMSHTMINPCQLKILKSFFPGRDTAAGFSLSPLEKYERIMGHFSQDGDVKKWNIKSNLRDSPPLPGHPESQCSPSWCQGWWWWGSPEDVTMVSGTRLGPPLRWKQPDLFLILLISVNFLWLHINIDTNVSVWFPLVHIFMVAFPRDFARLPVTA